MNWTQHSNNTAVGLSDALRGLLGWDSLANFRRVRSDVSHASKKRLPKKAVSQQLTDQKNIPVSYQSWVKNVFAPALVKVYLRERDLRNGGSRA